MGPVIRPSKACNLKYARSFALSRRSICCSRLRTVRCHATVTTPEETSTGAGATLIGAVKAHDASFTAALVLADTQGAKQVITASLDKSMALWTIDETGVQGQKFNPEGGPIFSFVKDPAAMNFSLLDQSVNRGVFCGSAAKSVVAWNPPNSHLDEKINLNGHTGWVRSVASFERWLFSCGCNHLKQWDASWPIPKEVASTTLFTGDILGLTAGGGKVFTCGADGSIRSWNISKAGVLSDGAVREKAHEGRVTAIAWHKNFLYSVSYDGSIKGWSSDSLDLVLEVKPEGAHSKERIHCMVVGPDGALYTGGEDKLVRKWSPSVLQQMAAPLEFHSAGVRALAAGSMECLVSGDANGDMAVWRIPSPPAPPAPSAPAAAAAANGVDPDLECHDVWLPGGSSDAGSSAAVINVGVSGEEGLLVQAAAAEVQVAHAAAPTVADGSNGSPELSSSGGGDNGAAQLATSADSGNSSTNDDFLMELGVAESSADVSADELLPQEDGEGREAAAPEQASAEGAAPSEEEGVQPDADAPSARDSGTVTSGLISGVANGSDTHLADAGSADGGDSLREAAAGASNGAYCEDADAAVAAANSSSSSGHLPAAGSKAGVLPHAAEHA